MTHIILSIVALVIIFLYIQPTLVSISKTQDELFQYSDASNKAAELNQQLASLTAVEQSFKTLDKIALDTYLPPTIDGMAIMADIATMASDNKMKVTQLTADELQLPVEDARLAGEKIETPDTSYVDFTLETNGLYTDFKAMLKSFEKNKYQLEVVILSFGDFIVDDVAIINPVRSLVRDYQIVLRAYAYSYTGN